MVSVKQVCAQAGVPSPQVFPGGRAVAMVMEEPPQLTCLTVPPFGDEGQQESPARASRRAFPSVLSEPCQELWVVQCSLECWSSQPPFPSQAAFYLLLFVASDIWVKMLNYLAAVVRWILKQLTSAKNVQLALCLGFCHRKCLFSVCLPAVCASCCCGHVCPRSTFVPQRVPAA